jgi:gliding motility-associated-like protein
MKKIQMIFLLAVRLSTAAQTNLVSNGSMEFISDCYIQFGDIEKAIGWINANNGTADLYNSCSTNPLTSVPFNGVPYISYQQAFDGNSYAGIAVLLPNYINSAYEYIETKLSSTLKNKVNYYVRFYVSPMYNVNSNNCFVNQIGLCITDYQVNQPSTINNSNITTLVPQIYHQGSYIDDTLNWTKISGCYKAFGNEQYITIGNFKNIDSTKYIVTNPNEVFVSYLFVDNVGVFEFNPVPDTVYLCNGESKVFNAHFLNASDYHWSTGNIDSVQTITNAGKYTVDVSIDGCILYDTVIVINPDNLPLVYEKKMCKNASLVLTSPISGSYSWNNGDSTKMIVIKEAKNYQLTVTNECGVFNFTYLVHEEVCDCEVFMPNAFTPNNDGTNDEFKPIFECGDLLNEMQFLIMDRWGNTVFKIDNTLWGWDGKYKGNDSEVGTYFYLLKYWYSKDGHKELKIKKGELVLLR